MDAQRFHDRGFSIVELLVAIAVLAIGVYGIYAKFVDVDRLSHQRLDNIQGRLLAQQELERLRACPYESLKAFQPDELPPSIPEHTKYHFRDQVTIRDDGLLELTVVVGWGAKPGEPFEPGTSVTVIGVKAP